jgi:GNAT superfamily N-acetyltransferase
VVNKYALYIKEREGLDTYEDEKGFFTYEVENEAFVVHDLFVLPEFREKGNGNQYARKIEELARENNCKMLACFTCIDANNWIRSDKYIRSNGYVEVLKEANMIYYKKEL